MVDSLGEPSKYQIVARIHAEIASRYALARDSGCTKLIGVVKGFICFVISQKIVDSCIV